MIARPQWTCAFVATVLIVSAAAPAHAQDKPVTEEFLELIIQAFAAERAGLDKVGPELQAINKKIAEFEECKELYDAAAEVSGSRLGGLAARAAIRAKCGASNTDGFLDDRKKVLAGPEKAALDILRIKAPEYGRLKEKMQDYLRTAGGFSAPELAVLKARRGDIAGALGIDLSLLAAGGTGGGDGGRAARGGRGGRGMGGAWTADYAWGYIGDMFAIMYMSGATIFEKPYDVGQWTRWEIVSRDAVYEGDEPGDVYEEKRVIERAFIGRTEEGGEWWRIMSVDLYDDGGVVTADTVILESLFKPLGEAMKQLVRVRARLPGQEPNEMMVPQHMAMLSLLSVFPMKPTEESVQGATVGSENVASFNARHVRFAAGDGGAIEWWIAADAPGGWVRFRQTDARDTDIREPGSYTMQLVDSGTGARSVLGVMD
ncbi:MAG TPA: hypothetical protein VMN60_14255 [Longimicrobiales bacterium]|nr:hypothetical protein [Longimicrobiales bacterium]